MSDFPTGKTYVKVIGKEPPGIGNSPKLIYMERPRYNRVAAGWDTCEELFWAASMDLAQIADGFERTAALKTFAALPSTGRFWVTGWNQVGSKAGRPIIRVLSKGWYETKADIWAPRRVVNGDPLALDLGGQCYTTRTYWTVTASNLAYTVLTAPSQTAGLPGVLAANYATVSSGPTFIPGSVALTGSTFTYFTGATPGWFISGRQIEYLPTTQVPQMIIDSHTRIMKYDGTNV